MHGKPRIQAAAAVEGAGVARARAAHARSGEALRAGRAARAAVPGGIRARALRNGLLLGRRTQVLAGTRRLHDGGRLRRRPHPQPQLRGGLLGPHRAQRSRARGLRPRAVRATPRCCASSGRATTRRRACARATTPEPSTAPGSTFTRTRSASRRSPRAARSSNVCARRAGARSRPRSCDAREFYYAEAYHQQYLAKNPHGYCGMGGTGVACPVGPAAVQS